MASSESPPVHMGFILLTVSLSAASWACSIMLLVSMYVMVDWESWGRRFGIMGTEILIPLDRELIVWEALHLLPFSRKTNPII